MTRTLHDLQNRIAADLTRDDLTGDTSQARSQTPSATPSGSTAVSGSGSTRPAALVVQHGDRPAGLWRGGSVDHSEHHPDRRAVPAAEPVDLPARPLRAGRFRGDLRRHDRRRQADRIHLHRPDHPAVADPDRGLRPAAALLLTSWPRSPPHGDSNAWTDDAEELVRTHAKMLLYMDVLEDDQNAQRMATKIPALLDGLRSETSARMATGRIRGTEF